MLLQMYIAINVYILCYREYKARKGRWENAVAVWQRFHKDIKDLTVWINNAEKTIRETKLPTGDLDIDKAKQEQGVRNALGFTVILLMRVLTPVGVTNSDRLFAPG